MSFTFSAVPSTVSSKASSPGTWYRQQGGVYTTGDAALVLGIKSVTGQIEQWEGSPAGPFVPSVGGTAEINFGLDTTAIILNGVSTPFVSFPSGFRMLTARLSMSISLNGGSGNILMNTQAVQAVGVGTNNYDLTTLDIYAFLNSYGFDATTIAGWNPPETAHANHFTFTGTYDILTTTWTLDTPGPLVTGDTIALSSSGINALNFTQTNGVDLVYVDDGITYYVPITTFAVQTANSLQFVIPLINFSGPFYISFEGDGTQFSGFANLGTLTINIADSSGIYRIIDNQTHDTVYLSAVTGDTTQDVAIPDPFIRTGFLGG